MNKVERAKQSLALAFDFPDLREAERIGARLNKYFGYAKIGLELYLSEGQRAIDSLSQLGYKIFLDLKVFDIPNTMNKAAKAIARKGVQITTFHLASGEDGSRAFIEGLLEEGGNTKAAGVSLLTSEDSDYLALRNFANLAQKVGADYMVCSALDINLIKSVFCNQGFICPSIRSKETPRDDQKRTTTVSEALELGATLLVIGRPITKSSDCVAASELLFDEAVSFFESHWNI